MDGIPAQPQSRTDTLPLGQQVGEVSLQLVAQALTRMSEHPCYLADGLVKIEYAAAGLYGLGIAVAGLAALSVATALIPLQALLGLLSALILSQCAAASVISLIITSTDTEITRSTPALFRSGCRMGIGIYKLNVFSLLERYR